MRKRLNADRGLCAPCDTWVIAALLSWQCRCRHSELAESPPGIQQAFVRLILLYAFSSRARRSGPGGSPQTGAVRPHTRARARTHARTHAHTHTHTHTHTYTHTRTHTYTHTHTHTHNGNRKQEQSKKAVKENSSGAAGQP